MTRQNHHPSCPARDASPAPLSPLDGLWADARCICPPPRRRRRAQVADALAFAAMLGLMVGLPVYLLWRYTA